MSEDGEDDIIFKHPEESRVAKLRDQLVTERTFEIEFAVKNDKIYYSHSQSEVPLHWIATGIVEAVRGWHVEHVDYKPRTADALSQLGAPKITYRHIVVLDWANQMIKTSLKKNDGPLFLRVMAYFVEQFRAATTPRTTEGGAN